MWFKIVGLLERFFRLLERLIFEIDQKDEKGRSERKTELELAYEDLKNAKTVQEVLVAQQRINDIRRKS